jgi:hypothetical protein
MSTPVKTSLMNAILDALETISSIGQVAPDPSSGPDRETAKYPVAFAWDDIESVETKNRVVQKSFILHVEVWIKPTGTQTISQIADIIQADVNKALLTDAGVKQWSIGIEETNGADKLYFETEGMVHLKYKMTYAHKYADAYDPAK